MTFLPNREIPIARENKAKSIRMLSNRDMEVTQHSGNVFIIPAAEIEMQSWVTYSMLAEL